ncbi:MAG: 4Fe-4S single cluster domain-containing protein [Anaerolineae bacterium]
MSVVLNLGDRLEHFAISTLNGPGARYVLFVQGCSHRCTKDCLNPEYLAVRDKVLLPVEQVRDYVLMLQAQRGIEGVTFLGGEPFEQAIALAELASLLRQAGLSIMTYTGFTIEHIRRQALPGWLDLLAVTDLLVDGPFLPPLQSDTLRWRGSSNQRLIFLSDRYSAAEIEAQPIEKGFNIIVRPDGTVKISGLQNKQHAEQLIQALRERRIIE